MTRKRSLISFMLLLTMLAVWGIAEAGAAPLKARNRRLNIASDELAKQQAKLEQANIRYADFCNYCMPTPNRVVTSRYGRRWGRKHEGIDIRVKKGDTIRSAFKGRVALVTYDRKGYGYYVVVRHQHGLETLYAHMSKQLVKVGQHVEVGTPVGLGGSTGRSSGPHLHFEIRLNGEALNPVLMFDFPNQTFCYVNHQEYLDNQPGYYNNHTQFSLAATGILTGNSASNSDEQQSRLSDSKGGSNRKDNPLRNRLKDLTTLTIQRMSNDDARPYWSSSSRQGAPPSYHLG